MKIATLIATAVAVLLPCAAHAAACDVLKNATYAGIMRGKFDAFPDAFAGVSLTFDANGVGAGRGVIAYDPASTAAVQSPYSGVTCASNADGKSGMLNFAPAWGRTASRSSTAEPASGRGMKSPVGRSPAGCSGSLPRRDCPDSGDGAALDQAPPLPIS